ncbi:MAG: hypothetical protein JEY94_09610, partial [Melioribacteraceae bacterium]|nr:hypothetical protein [Melioribacteraceae bacterium]
MKKVIFSFIVITLFSTSLLAQSVSNVEEAVRTRVQHDVVSIDLSSDNVQNNAENVNNVSVYAKNSSAQLEDLGERFGWWRSNDQLDNLGERLSWWRSNDQLEDLGERLSWWRSNDQLEDLGERLSWWRSNDQLEDLGERLSWWRSN